MSRPRAHGALLLVAGALLQAAGCDRVGGPLVDYQKPPEVVTVPRVRCAEPPECEGGLEPQVPLQALPVAPIYLEGCGPPREGDCTQFRLDPDDEDAGIEFERPRCQWSLDTAQLPALDASALRCAELTIEGDGETDTITLKGVDWTDTNVSVSSERPLVLELEAAALQQTYLALTGPVTLRITHAQRFAGVRIAGQASQHGLPLVELRHVDGERLSAGDEERAFAGTLALVRANLVEAQLVASHVSLESVAVARGLITASQLNAVDTELFEVGLEVGSGVLATSVMRECIVHECGALTLIDGKIRYSWFPGCGVAPLRVYGASVIGGRFDGEIESDRSNFSGVLFGSREPTDLLLWDGSVLSTNFCAGSQSVILAATANIGCSKCDGWNEGDVLACLDPEWPATLRSNWCEQLKQAQVCEEPLPPRERPLPLPAE